MTPATRRDRRIRTAAVWGAAGLALAGLPERWFAPGWLLAFSLPALLLLALRRAGVRPGAAAGVAAVAQVAAVLGTAQVLGTPEQRTALGCTLIPPLLFLAVRQRGGDAARALFFSFCLFLIGVILGGTSPATCIAFLACAAVGLHADAALTAVGRRASGVLPAPGGLRLLTQRSWVTGLTVVSVLAVFQLVRLVPAPGVARTPPAPAAEPRRAAAAVGPSSQFDFDFDSGTPLDLRAERLLEVAAVDGRPLSPFLYLRGVHFDVAGLDEWEIADPSGGLVPAPLGDWVLRAAVAGLPLRALELTYTGDCDRMLFVPPGTVALRGPRGTLGNPARELFRLRSRPPVGTHYRVVVQDLRHRGEDLPADPRWANLTRLGVALEPWRARFRRLLDAAGVRGGELPFAAARRIAAYLQRRCSYALLAPEGPYPHSLLNFLDGDRRGFCMHFASATAIALRAAGIPCRIGAGLYGGTPDELDPARLTFGSRSAHAWVEIPIQGYGWLVFDPTPAVDDPLRPRPGDLDPTRAIGEAQPDGDPESGGLAGLGTMWEPEHRRWLWAIAAALCLWVLRPRRRERTRGETAAAQIPRIDTARRLLAKLLAALQRAGHPRARGQALRELLAGLDDSLPKAEIATAFDAYQEVRFGGRPFDDDRSARLRAAIDAVSAATAAR